MMGISPRDGLDEDPGFDPGGSSNGGGAHLKGRMTL